MTKKQSAALSCITNAINSVLHAFLEPSPVDTTGVPEALVRKGFYMEGHTLVVPWTSGYRFELLDVGVRVERDQCMWIVEGAKAVVSADFR